MNMGKMTYNEYVEHCERIYRESCDDMVKQGMKPSYVDLMAIVTGNIAQVSETYLAPSGIEDFCNDVYLDVMEKVRE